MEDKWISVKKKTPKTSAEFMRNKVELELTDDMLKKISETMDLELDILRGEKTKMSDGRWYCVIYVSDEKLKMFKDLIQLFISSSAPPDELRVSIMGLDVNKN